ncbi:hypothetical protein [Sphingomicrobium sediminis]|uniref:Lipoprotein n=1 Tax=Sphingomicrobium sediminis TaxID=2950949 RepID=A0A9X2EGZ9_9SPHN|nr:hypothetical protein [Sphingomicrobium sediminis]MCM8557256.1 hypothetical protein [Sphingomicrobium sediminis]
MQLKTSIVAISTLLLASCGGSESAVEEAPADELEAPANDVGAAEDDGSLFGGEEEQAAAAPQPVALSCDATAYCSGPLVVTANNLVLSRGDRELYVRGPATFQNRSNEDIRIVLSNKQADITLDNGSAASTYRGDITGMNKCRNSAQECFDADPNQFTTLVPGDSPARINLYMRGNLQTSLIPSLSEVATGTLVLEAYLVEAGRPARRIDITLSGIPIKNQITQ